MSDSSILLLHEITDGHDSGGGAVLNGSPASITTGFLQGLLLTCGTKGQPRLQLRMDKT